MYNPIMAGQRVLGRIRLSRLTEESTSAARQRDLIEQWADMNGHTVVGYAEDLDVSGSIDPFAAPALAPWFREDRRHEWDILVAWKLDRYGRDSIRLNKLFGWCIENGKTLVSTSEGIDLGTPVGRLIANVIAFLAEGELEAIRERTKASRRKLLETGRWPGGRIPYGLRPVQVPEGGWKLAVHPEHAKVIRGIVDEVIGGAAIGAVVDRLNDRGLPAPRGGKWTDNTVWKMLTAKYMIGHATYEGRSIRDDHGLPVLNAEPILSQQRWNDLQAAVQLRKTPEESKRTKNVSPLLGVALCKVCESRMVHRTYYRDTGKGEYRYYHCPNKHFPQIVAEDLEEILGETFLHELGEHKVCERVFIQAENHQIELEEANRAVDELTALVGTMTSDTLRKRLTEQLRALDFRVSELEKLPTREARWEYRETDKTYREEWETADTEQRRQLLLRSGITARVAVNGKTRATPGAVDFELRIPDDVRERLGA